MSFKTLFLSLLIRFHLSFQEDICTDRAALVLFDEFYLSQDFESDIKLNFSNYVHELNRIHDDLTPFETNAIKYDTEAELDELEPSALIPFTHDTNLIQIKSPNKDFMTACANKDAKVLEIDSSSIGILKRIMEKLGIEKVPFRAFDDRGAQVSASGTVLKNIPTLDSNTKQLLRYFFPTFSRTGTSSFIYPSNDTIVSLTSDPVDGFCIKPNNMWDRKGPSRNKWLTLIKKITSNLSLIKSWKDSFSSLFTNLPVIDQLYGKVSDKFTPNTPLALTGISNFLSKYKLNSTWESSTPSAFSDFQTFIKNFKSLAKVFIKIPPLKTRVNTLANITETKITEMVAAPFDDDKIQRFLDLNPDKVNITGPISIKPLYQLGGSGGIVGAQAKFKIYEANDKIKIYHVKPLIYHGFVTTVTHVLMSSKHKLALTHTPVPYGCENQRNNQNQEDDIKICKGYTTPGLESLSTIDSDICGAALSTIKGEVEFTKCPLTPAPSTPLAYRVSCGNRTVVISSIKSLKIRVFCDGSSGPTVTLLDSFPSYLKTECEVRQVEKGGFEPILLPQLHSDFIMQQLISDVEKSPINKSIKPATTPSPSSNTTSISNSTSVTPSQSHEPWFYASLSLASILSSAMFMAMIIKRKPLWQLFLKYFICWSRVYNPFNCKGKKCCKKTCCGSETKTDDDSEYEIETIVKKKKKSNIKNTATGSMPLLPQQPPSAPSQDPDSYLEPDFPIGSMTPASARSIRENLTTYNRQQTRSERYNNTLK